MSDTSPALTFENDSSLPGRQLRRLVYVWNGLYIAMLILTLAGVLWRTSPAWGWREAILAGLVSLQAALYWLFFVATHYPHRATLTRHWLPGYFLVSLGLWLIEWHLEAGFWWIIWIQVFQLYISVPLKAAIPATGLTFLVVAHFDSGLDQFFGFPLGEVIERLIPWLIISMSSSFVALLTRANLERARLIAELQSANQRLEMARQQEVELATLRERERLARDLHDSLGHALVTLAVQLEAVQRLYRVNPEEASKRVDEMKNLTRASMETLRDTLAGLRASGLNQRPLAQALAGLSAETGRRTGLEITCRVDPAVDRLSLAMTETLWRVTQEALMNIEKHAAARHVQLDLHLKPETVTLRLADDGVGLPANAANRPGHFGLRGMRERIEGLGGVLTLSGNGQAGTVIEACLPLIGGKEYPGEEDPTYEYNSDSIGRRSNLDAAGAENDP